jgi:pilus assembly protein Flp/PilA
MLQHTEIVDVREEVQRIVAATLKVANRLVARLQEGQSMVEYAIIAALIAVVCMAAVQTLGTGIAGVFTRILNSISGIG